MDARVIAALQKWPDVAAVYGWLSLDERGRWRLDGGLVRNRNAVDAINRNYAGEETGRWYYQNGPQRVYVDLAYTPWVYRLDGAARLETHTGRAVNELRSVWLDDTQHLLLSTEHGVGIVSDQDLDNVLDALIDERGQPVDWDTLAAILEGHDSSALYLSWGERHPVGRIHRSDVAARFEFINTPRDNTRLED